jgi:hypothetical protein
MDQANRKVSGRISKTGNTHIRKLLRESAWHYPRPVAADKRLAERRAESELVIAHADKVAIPLHGTYYPADIRLTRTLARNGALRFPAHSAIVFLYSVTYGHKGNILRACSKSLPKGSGHLACGCLQP